MSFFTLILLTTSWSGTGEAVLPRTSSYKPDTFSDPGRQRTERMRLCFAPRSAEPVAMGMLQGAPQSSHQSAAGYRSKPGLLPRRRSWDGESSRSCLCVSVCRQGWVSAQRWHKEQNCSCFFFSEPYAEWPLGSKAPQAHQSRLSRPLVTGHTFVSSALFFFVLFFCLVFVALLLWLLCGRQTDRQTDRVLYWSLLVFRQGNWLFNLDLSRL